MIHDSDNLRETLSYKYKFIFSDGTEKEFHLKLEKDTLELIEQPIISEKSEVLLQPGMIFALEPKLVFEDEFVAGIESVFLVTENGHRIISHNPVKVFVC